MPSFSDLDEVARKALTIFYVLDTSGSMTGAPISTVNSAMRETIEVLKHEAKNNADAQLKIAVLSFNSNATWLNPNGAEDIEDFPNDDLQAGGLTAMGKALDELNDKLSRHKFLQSVAGNLMPVIVFMTDGYATDDYRKALDRIRQNKWFKRAAKIGFAIGDDADIEMICSIVGNREAVIHTDDLDVFKKLLQFVSVTSSMLVSSTVTGNEGTTGKTIVGQAVDEGLVPPGALVGDTVSYDPEPETSVAFDGSDSDDDWGGDWD